MPLEYERKDLLTARSERVKGIDFHPSEPWILTTLYSGHVNIWSYESKTIVKTFELTDVPVRAGRFVARKNWIVCGSDDFQVRVYNYNTSEKIASFEAHPDYIRAIVVHPTASFVLTASDDMTIKLWDWDQGWKCKMTYEGHSHYVMGLSINPKDTNTFASACLDRTVKVWSFGSPHPNYTIEAHESKGVNHVDYYPHANNPYLLTTSDDQTVKIWDYTTKNCINTLGGGSDGHTSNVSFACYHSVLPVIISGSEDGTIKLWDSTTYKLLDTIRYNLERAWCVSYQRGEQGVAVGFDDGAVVVKLGRDDPAISMQKQGWLSWFYKNELHIARLPDDKEAAQDALSGVQAKDGSVVNTIEVKAEDFKSFYPQEVAHSRSARHFSVCGINDYTIHSSRGGARGQSIETVGSGTGTDLVWGVNTKTNNFAIRTGPPGKAPDNVKIMINNQKFDSPTAIELDIGFSVEGLTGGVLLGVKVSGSILFYDWDTRQLVKQISASPKKVYWSESGELATLACDDRFYVVRYSQEAYKTNLKAGLVDEEGVEGAVEAQEEILEAVISGQWVGDCFMYTNSTNRLCYLVGDKTYTVAHFDKPMYLLSYLPNKGKGTAYLTDKDINIVSYSISLSIVEYQTLVLRGDMETAETVLEGIEEDDQLTKVARFLEGQGYKERALEVTRDQEHRFDLALALNDLEVALTIARETDLEHRWKIVGDAAMAQWNLVLSEECFNAARDLGSLLLLYTATNNVAGLRELSQRAEEAAMHNVAFSCLCYLGDVDNCIDLLIRTNRVAEAVLFAQTYKPSRCKEIVGQWRSGLEKAGKSKVSRMLGVPPGAEGAEGDADLFPEWEENLRLEQDFHSKPALIDVDVKDTDGPAKPDGVEAAEVEAAA